LHSRIGHGSIKTDRQVIEFAEKENEANELVVLLEMERKKFQATSLLQLFDWYRMQATIRSHAVWIQDKKVPDFDAAITLSRSMSAKVEQQQEVAAKFVVQLHQLLDTAVQTGEMEQLQQRVNKAIGYFTQSIYEDLIQPLQKHITEVKKAKSKKYLLQLMALESDCWNKLRHVWEVSYADLEFTTGLKDYTKLRDADAAAAAIPVAAAKEKAAKGKVEKGSSRRGTLELYLGGKSIADIAAARQLAIGTIESHLAQCVEAGEMDIHRFVSERTMRLILKHIGELGATAAGPIKERVGDSASFAEIRVVQWYLKKKQEEQIMNG